MSILLRVTHPPRPKSLNKLAYLVHPITNKPRLFSCASGRIWKAPPSISPQILERVDSAHQNTMRTCDWLRISRGEFGHSPRLSWAAWSARNKRGGGAQGSPRMRTIFVSNKTRPPKSQAVKLSCPATATGGLSRVPLVTGFPSADQSQSQSPSCGRSLHPRARGTECHPPQVTANIPSSDYAAPVSTEDIFPLALAPAAQSSPSVKKSRLSASNWMHHPLVCGVPSVRKWPDLC